MEIGLHNRHPQTAPRDAAPVGGDGADDCRDGRLHQSQERWASGTEDDVDRPTKNARLRNRLGHVWPGSEEKLWVTMRPATWADRNGLSGRKNPTPTAQVTISLFQRLATSAHA